MDLEARAEQIAEKLLLDAGQRPDRGSRLFADLVQMAMAHLRGQRCC